MRGLYILSKESCNWIKRYIYLNLFLCVIAYWISNQPLTDLIWDILQCQVISLSRTISWSLWIKVKLFNAHHKVCGTHMSLSLTQNRDCFPSWVKRGFSKIVKRITSHSLQGSAFDIWDTLLLYLMSSLKMSQSRLASTQPIVPKVPQRTVCTD